MKQEKRKRKFLGLHVDDPKAPYILFGSIIVVWLLCWFLVSYFIDDPSAATTNWSTRGQFGDMFGTVNALFSGLAFAGIIFTILLQREELEAQRHELEETRNEFKQQNKTLRLQSFEST